MKQPFDHMSNIHLTFTICNKDNQENVHKIVMLKKKKKQISLNSKLHLTLNFSPLCLTLAYTKYYFAQFIKEIFYISIKFKYNHDIILMYDSKITQKRVLPHLTSISPFIGHLTHNKSLDSWLSVEMEYKQFANRINRFLCSRWEIRYVFWYKVT